MSFTYQHSPSCADGGAYCDRGLCGGEVRRFCARCRADPSDWTRNADGARIGAGTLKAASIASLPAPPGAQVGRSGAPRQALLVAWP